MAAAGTGWKLLSQHPAFPPPLNHATHHSALTAATWSLQWHASILWLSRHEGCHETGTLQKATRSQLIKHRIPMLTSRLALDWEVMPMYRVAKGLTLVAMLTVRALHL